MSFVPSGVYALGTSPPTHTYTSTGQFTVSLRITDGAATAAVTKTNYIAVGDVRVIAYEYDRLYRLTEADYRSTGLTTGSSGEYFAYEYDAVGNRTAYTATITQTTVITYDYDRADRLLNAGSVAYTWNALGQLLDDGQRTYAWDAAGRLISVTLGDDTTLFEYNGDGDRLSKAVNGTLTTYTLDPSASSGQGVAAGLPQVLVERSEANATLYLHGLDLIGEQGTAWAYHLNDGLGSVRQLVDGSGQVTLAQGTRPFGAPLWQEGSGSSGFGYTGEQVDASTGLVFLRARYYEPGVGRFLSPDPVLGNHLYMYVEGNPINLVDPSGRDGIPTPQPKPTPPPPPSTPVGTPVLPTPVGTPVPQTEQDKINWLVQHYRYLRTERYGWFDLGHANPRNKFYEDVQKVARSGGEIPVGGTVRGPFEFYAYYWVEKLDDDQVEGVAMGIFMDHSFRVERWQGEFPLGLGEGTSFAIEDFPSNYIGFLAAFRNQGRATKADSVKLILEYLGPAEWTNEGPPHSDNFDGYNLPFICVGPTGCAGAHQRYIERVKNYEFTPRIEISPGNYANIAWPCNDLVIQPIGSGPDTWHFVRESHNRNIGTYLEFLVSLF